MSRLRLGRCPERSGGGEGLRKGVVVGFGSTGEERSSRCERGFRTGKYLGLAWGTWRLGLYVLEVGLVHDFWFMESSSLQLLAVE
jgi:hypothetical protein